MLTYRQMFIHMFILVLKTMPQMTYLFANYDQNSSEFCKYTHKALE